MRKGSSRKGINQRHGMTGTSTHNIWWAMRQRCENANVSCFNRYGGRGIKVCKRWLKFENFLADMGVRPPEFSLDRIDTNGDYKPSNCRWATQKEQTRNMRSNVIIRIDGEKRVLAEWAEISGIKEATIRYRRRHGIKGSALLAPPNYSAGGIASNKLRSLVERSKSGKLAWETRRGNKPI